MTIPILYSFRRCPYAMRARLALVATYTPVELREVVLRDKPDEMLTASPKGTVPVLILHDNTVLEESRDIMHWALENGDREGWLAFSEAQISQMGALVDEEGQAYLFGDTFSFADGAILPFVRQFAHVDRDWFWAQDWPNTIRWLETFLESERFKAIMSKYPQWKTGDDGVAFGHSQHNLQNDLIQSRLCSVSQILRHCVLREGVGLLLGL